MPPREVRGAVSVVAVASDVPALSVPGDWNGLPVAPAALTWWVTSSSGHAVLPRTVAVDFRRALPPNAAFWQVYARGTFQNHPPFGNKQYIDAAGRYEYRLTRPLLDTRTLPDAVYKLHVRAVDVRGNSGSRSQSFTVCNKDPAACAAARSP